MKKWLPLSATGRALLGGTLLLTCVGFVCRMLGFLYRIFLSQTIGAEGLGIYNMVHPVYGVCFALCAGSIQTALSQYIASHLDRGKQSFCAGLMIALSFSVIFACLICKYATFLANVVLMEADCAPYLPYMGISVPFAAVHSCINGWYYGVRKSRVPAWSQLAEQIIRMTIVFFFASCQIQKGRPITVSLAVFGHLVGEIAAAVFTFLCILLFPPQPTRSLARQSPSFFTDVAPLMHLALPLMGNRFIVNILASMEAVWIPGCLRQYGMSSSQAFAVYGALTGMALPFVYFPSAISNSLAVLLLPSVAQAQAEGRHGSIRTSIALSLRYSMYMGILCIGIFLRFGASLGESVFHSITAGQFIPVLAWICPFLYLASTLGSILNGLGQTRTTFLLHVVSLLLRIAFIRIGVPRHGIYACLCGMLAGEIVLALTCLCCLNRFIPFSWNVSEMILKPSLILAAAFSSHQLLFSVLSIPSWIPLFIQTVLQIGLICFVYAGLLLLFHLARPAQQ